MADGTRLAGGLFAVRIVHGRFFQGIQQDEPGDAQQAEELSRLLERYRVPADEDTLTGLLNRRTFFKLAMSELRRAKEFHQDSHPALCLALADLDNFKNVNGHFGHANGDRVLQLFACRLREASHDDDLCCRFGGDEFIILIPRIGRDESIEHVKPLTGNLPRWPPLMGQPLK